MNFGGDDGTKPFVLCGRWFTEGFTEYLANVILSRSGAVQPYAGDIYLAEAAHPTPQQHALRKALLGSS